MLKGIEATSDMNDYCSVTPSDISLTVTPDVIINVFLSFPALEKKPPKPVCSQASMTLHRTQQNPSPFHRTVA